MKRVVIFGAGGLGREVLETVRALAAVGHDIVCVGFAIDPGFAVPEAIGGLPVRCGLEAYLGQPDLHFVIALGEPAARRRAALTVSGAVGSRFANVIHPAATIGAIGSIGAGTMVLGPASITTEVTIGSHVLINPMASVAHDCVLADFATLSPAVALAGGVLVGEGAELGTGAVVLPRQKIGRWSRIGAGAVVTRPVTANTTVVGVPARPIAKRKPG